MVNTIQYLVTLRGKRSIQTTVVFDNQALEFNTDAVIETKTDHHQVYHILNAYLDFRSIEDPKFPETLFGVLSEALSKLSGFSPPQIYDKIARETICTVMDLIDYDRVITWLKQYEGFLMPTSIEKVFDQSIVKSGSGSREQTYIEEDYFHLTALSIVSRAICPIVGQYLYLRGEDLGKQMRYFYLYTQIQDHPIFTTPSIEKLILYIEKNYDSVYQAKDGATAIGQREKAMVRFTNEGFSPEDVVYWILANIFFVELVNGEIFNPVQRDTNLVTRIYSHVRRKLGGDKDISPKIEDKYIGSAGLNEDDKTSVLEQYNQIVTSIQPGKKEELNWYYWDIENIRKQYYPYVNPLLVERYLEEIPESVYVDAKIPQIHIILMSLVLRDAFDVRLSSYLRLDVMSRLFALTRAILYTIDQKYFALVMASFPRYEENFLSSIESLESIKKDTYNILKEKYPFTYMERKGKDLVEINPIDVTIDEIKKLLTNYRYEVLANKEDVMEVFDGKYTTSLIVPYDIREKIAWLLITLAKETDNEHRD